MKELDAESERLSDQGSEPCGGIPIFLKSGERHCSWPGSGTGGLTSAHTMNNEERTSEKPLYRKSYKLGNHGLGNHVLENRGLGILFHLDLSAATLGCPHRAFQTLYYSRRIRNIADTANV